MIKASYRAMMQKMRLHPDLGGDESVAKILNEAVTTLCNPDARAAYDTELFEQATNAPGGTPAWNKQNETPENTQSGQSAPPNNHHSRSANDETNSGKPSQPYKPKCQSHLPKRDQCPFCHASYPAFRATGIGYPTDERCAQCKAAATPIEQINKDSADDVRKIYRHHHHTQASLWTQWPMQAPVKATMTDMSIAGCAIECVNALAANSVIVLDTELLNGICVVRYCKKNTSTDTFAIGMEFLTLDITSGSGAVFSATA